MSTTLARRTASASSAPTSTTESETSGAPPSQASLASGLSAWEKASRPQGKPPKGIADLASSAATHRTATAGTCQRARCQMTRPRRVHDQAAAKAPTKPASATESASHGTGPTAYSAQVICGRKNASPKTNPTRAFHRALSRPRARTRTAIAT